MSAPIFDFATALKNSIQAGQSIQGSNVLEIIADNGQKIGDGVFKVIQGGNGQATSAYAVTGAVGAGGTATTSGLAFLTMELGLAGAAIAPCLGILAGIGLYNLAPEFWDDVSERLINAGKTIGGKIITYFDGDNIYYDEETIEIFKNAFIDHGMFDLSSDYYPPQEYTPTINVQLPIKTYLPNETATFTNGNYVICSTSYDVIMFTVSVNGAAWVFAASHNAYAMGSSPYRSYDITTGQLIQQWDVQTQYEVNGQTFYLSGYSLVDSSNKDNVVTNASSILDAGIELAYMIMFGQNTGADGSNLQPDATYPTSGEQFPLTYPDWYPYNYPSVAPAGLPDVYPVKYPNTEPDPYPEQNPAQNPDPESVPDTYPYIMPDLPIPYPTPTPTPEPTPTPDPDPQPDPDPIPDPDIPTPTPDPVDPNPDPTPTSPIIDPTSPTSVNSTKLFTVYNPDETALNDLGAYLWDSNLIEILKKIWQNPFDGIISLIQVYATPTTSAIPQHIILGYLDSEVDAHVVTSQFVTIDCGTIAINEDKHNATDYSPYTSLSVYLPFIGFVELDVNEFMDGQMSISYKVDVYTGTCIATIKAIRTTDTPDGAPMYEFSGNCSQQIPLTSGDATGVLTALTSAVGAGIAVASGGGFGVVAGAAMVGNSLTHEMFHVSRSGNLSANAGIMGYKKPFAIVSRRHCYDANNYNAIYGYPSNKTVKLVNHIGNYTRIKSGFLKTTATQPEHDEIMTLLKEGVIL